ncbi:hypothetical protein AB5I41_03175 [Sphingomonas sp. MMS24-JH45]
MPRNADVAVAFSSHREETISFTNTTQWVAVAVALVAGWLFGLASHPGGKKWKARYIAERERPCRDGKARDRAGAGQRPAGAGRTGEREHDHSTGGGAGLSRG